MALADFWSDGDDTDCDYYDTPSGNVWCPGDELSQPPPAPPAQAGDHAVVPMPILRPVEPLPPAMRH